MATLTLQDETGITKVTAETGASLAALLRNRGLLDQPCGVGKCGKCLIYADTEPCAEELRLLGKTAVASGLRLACHTTVQDGMCVTLPRKSVLRVLTEYARMDYTFTSRIEKERIELSLPCLADQRSDRQRVLDACTSSHDVLTLAQYAKLPELMRSGVVYALYDTVDRTLVGISGEDAQYGLVVDIGTTTVAALLVDLHERRVVASRGAQNAQAPFGADVISRIQQSMEHGVVPLQQAIVGQIDGILASLRTECDFEDVSVIAITGNTTMLHLLTGLPAAHISRAPFIPVMTDALRCNASAFGLHSLATTFLLPGISAYIGADTVASLLAAVEHETPRTTFLLVDFGTNAETVLFADGIYYACSAAAGPCFEGATLSCGMAGQNGAIDAVFAQKSDSLEVTGFTSTVINGGKARGLCGSGVVDAIALLLDSGDLDETGRLSPREDRKLDNPCGIPAFTEEHTENKGQSREGIRFQLTEDVYLSQKDIREVQLAKAAVRAGIEVLLTEAGITAAEVETLYLAGGFGSAIRPESAVRIGLIPEELLDRVRVLGNAACFGALRAITDATALPLMDDILQHAKYIELSAHSGFCDTYVANMLFPQGD